MHDKIINDILDWIEDNLTKPISTIDVIKKSGYSQRYFQDLFLYKTKSTIAKYILSRKLSMSAILLKLTRYSISEISNDYSFTSQQSFSRAFKRYFKVTPEFYRKSKFWDFRYYRPQHKVFDFKKINCQLIYLSKDRLLDNNSDDFKFFDISIPFDFKSNIAIEGLGYKNKKQIEIIKSLVDSSNDNLCVSYNYFLSSKVKNKITVKYNIKYIHDYNFSFNKEGLKYYLFSFLGSWEDYMILSNIIYMRELPLLQAKRRDGYDIEIFNSGKLDKKICSLNYLIPII